MAYTQRSYGGSVSAALPSKIKCNRCKKVKGVQAFSAKQQNDLANHIHATPGFNAASMAYVPCIGCTPQQVVELNCFSCGLDKGLDKFSKAQRRTPDHAICWKCAEERDNYEPGAEEGDEDSNSATSESSEDEDDDYSVSATDTGTQSMSGTAPGTYSSRSTGGVPLSSDGFSTVGPSTARTSKTMPSDIRSITNSSVASSSNGRFAKVKASARKVVYHKAEEERRQANGSDSEGYVVSDSD